MEKAVLMMDYLKVTQKANNDFSHKGDCALDLGGKDTGIDNLKAPFTGKVKRIYSNCNAVWLESTNKVKYADGTEDYMVLLTFHDNNVSDLKVGDIVKQGEVYYQEGTKGNATGNHIHLTVSKGKYSGNGWHENEYGNWVANNQYDVHKALFLDSKTKVLNDGGYDWVKTDSYVVEEPKKELKSVDEVAQEVIAGKWGNNPERKEKLEEAGYNYEEVQGRVNEILHEQKKSDKKYLNLKPNISSWNVYKTNGLYRNSNTSDILVRLNPKKYGGLTYEILEDMGNYHFKIKTDMKGLGYIAGNPKKYSCTITDEPVYKYGNY